MLESMVNSKLTILNMYHELKDTMDKELKKPGKQCMTINKPLKIIKGNQNQPVWAERKKE